MTPTLEQLRQRNLEREARACAEAEGLTLEEMLSRAQTGAAAHARRRFYRAMRDRGYSTYSIARLVGRAHGTVLAALGLTARERKRAALRAARRSPRVTATGAAP